MSIIFPNRSSLIASQLWKVWQEKGHTPRRVYRLGGAI